MAWQPSLPATTTKLRLSPAIFQGNNTALQTAVSASTLNAAIAYIPTVTVPIYMYVAAAPTGWTAYSTVGDCLLGVVGGTSQYETITVGTVQGTWNGPGYALMPGDIPTAGASTPSQKTFLSSTNNYQVNAHSHDWTTTRPAAAVGLLVTKNA